MIIFGIDPGYRKTGYGIIFCSPQNRIRYLKSGVIDLQKHEGSTKLILLYKTLTELINCYQPQLGVCEDVFFAQNAQSTIKLGKILGISQCALAQQIPTVLYSTRYIKMIITNKGTAKKDEVLLIIRKTIEDLPQNLSFDESDALAAAMCGKLSLSPLVN
jgi:crossover junction endodeoxyribonuclease RuvC